MATPLQELRQVQRADVYKGDELAGHISRTAVGTRFEYRHDYDGPAVAHTLNRSEAALETRGVPPFFAGLLPEGARLLAVQSAVKTSLDDELSLLLAVGYDTVGDVRVVQADTDPDTEGQRVHNL